MGVGASVRSLMPLVDIEEEIIILEEYKDALTKQPEMVNNRLGKLKS